MNSTLEKTILSADGRYLADLELQPLEDYLQSHSLRLRAYCYLQEHSDHLILQVLRRMMPTHRQTIQEHGDKCKRDMSYVLRYAATCILRNDEALFQEYLVLWMQNIMTALKKEQQSAEAYRILKAVVGDVMPVDEAQLVTHYLDLFIDALLTTATA
jgi:hypothetical protein